MTNFYLDNRTTGREENAVRMSVNVKGVRYTANTGLTVFAKYWSKTAQIALTKRSTEAINTKGYTAVKFNTELKSISDFWVKIDATLEGTPTAEQLRLQWLTFKNRNNVQKRTPLEDFLNRYRKEVGKTWSDNTDTKFTTWCSIIKNFNQYNSVTDFSDPDKARMFVEYLRDNRHQKESSVKKYYSMLCQVIRFAEKKRYIESGILESIDDNKFSLIEQPVIYLTVAELKQMISFDVSSVEGKSYIVSGKHTQIDKNTLSGVRDIFTFCCLTSLRISDALSLRWDNVFDNHISVITEKTNDNLNIILNDGAKDILNRIKCEEHTIVDFVFPRISVPNINKYIKVFGYLCGIDTPIRRRYIRSGKEITETKPKYEMLSTHVARRTFVVTALSLGISPAVVMKFTGHRTFTAMKRYTDITSSAQAEAMNLFNKL